MATKHKQRVDALRIDAENYLWQLRQERIAARIAEVGERLTLENVVLSSTVLALCDQVASEFNVSSKWVLYKAKELVKFNE